METIEFEDRHAAALSEIIIRNLLEVNSVDYGLEEMEDMAKRFQPEDVKELAQCRHTLVALDKDQVVGTGSLANDFSDDDHVFWVLTVFVNPDQHGRGIGRIIMENLETKAIGLGCKRLILPSSLTSHKFYLKLGYSYIGGVAIQNDKKQYMMEKIL